MTPMNAEEMYMLVAPDGTPQMSVCGETFEECIGIGELMAQSGFMRPFAVLFSEGFKIFPVKVTITQNGDEKTTFRKKKSRVK